MSKKLATKKDYMILANLDSISKGSLMRVLNRNAPNLTICPECHVDDFTHLDTCSICRECNAGPLK